MLARECGLFELTAQLLVNRGVYTVEEARVFLNGDLNDLWSPYLLRDMGRAVARIRAALDAGEKVLVYGDYDVDGMTATALLVRVLRALGGEPRYYIPGRNDGYGLHGPVLERAAADGVGLVITVDCGVTAVAEVERAREIGLDVIVTDHHEPQGELPPVPVVNPRRRDCLYPFKDLAGAGVALKLVQALLDGQFPPEFLGLACLGTVADVMPLVGENRLLVRYGLPLLPDNPGIAALGNKTGPESPGVRDVAFRIAPLLNAAGRLGRAELGVELLLAEDADTARALAAELSALNEERKYLEEKVSAEVLAALGDWSELPRVVVIAGEGWNPGVVGIVASRLASRLDRPVALIAVEGEEGRGSARSNARFDLVEALTACRDLLTRFGGHRRAAGFTLPAGFIPRFAQAMNEYAAALPAREPVPMAEIDAVVNLDELSLPLLREIETLEPWGAGNEPPLLAAEGLCVLRCREVGRNGEHLKLYVGQGNTLIDAIGFNLSEARAQMENCSGVDLAFVPLINRWNGRETPEVKVVDWKPGSSGSLVAEAAAASDLAVLQAEPEDDDVLPPFLARVLRGETVTKTRGEVRLKRVYDLRHLPFWKAGAGRFLDGAQPTLVAVPNPEMIAEIAAIIRLARPDCYGRLARLTPAMGVDEHAAVTERFRSGAATILISVPPDGCALRPARIVVPGLMYGWSDWKTLARSGDELVLAFSRQDHERNWRHLRGLAPNRNCLLQLYRLLRDLAGDADFDRQVVVRGMRRRGYDYFCAATLDIGLAILGELGLVRQQGGRLELPKTSGRKLLSRSPTFRRVHRIKRDAWRCQQFFLRASRADLARFFGCDIISLGDDNTHGHQAARSQNPTI
jgi:single-stranded-DNA-specific exonuclease